MIGTIDAKSELLVLEAVEAGNLWYSPAAHINVQYRICDRTDKAPHPLAGQWINPATAMYIRNASLMTLPDGRFTEGCWMELTDYGKQRLERLRGQREIK